MKVFQILIAICLFAATIPAQNSPPVLPADKYENFGKFFIKETNERIVSGELFENKKLRLIGEKSIQFWNLETMEAAPAIKHEFDDLSRRYGFDFSPDKARIFRRSYKVKNPIKDQPETIYPATIYDASTGKIVKNLEGATKPIESAIWSKDNRILITSSSQAFAGAFAGEVELSFWDAATLERRATITTVATWHYLTHDGSKLLTSAAPKREFLGINYGNEKVAAIDVWNTADGKLENRFSFGDETDLFARSNYFSVAPDGKTLAFILKSRKNDRADKMVVWDIESQANQPKYVLGENPKIDDSKVVYSPDNKFVGFRADDKVRQYYDLETGAKKFETVNLGFPDFWFDNNRIAVFHRLRKLEAVEIMTGKQLYVEPIAYSDYTSTDNCDYSYDPKQVNVCVGTTVVTNYTAVQPHSDDKTFLASSNQKAEIYDATTGKILQKLVVPPAPILVKRKKKFFGLVGGDYYDYGPKLISHARWSADFEKILILNHDEKSLDIWKAKQ